MGEAQHTYDASMVLKAAGAVGASAAGTLKLDMAPGTLGHKATTPKVMGDLIIDVSAIEIADGDETYDIILQGSSDSDFGTAGNIREIVAVHLGAKGTKRSDSDKDDAAGRYIIPFRNESGGTVYRYLRIYTVVGGTITTGITYSAYIGGLTVL